MVFPFYLPGFCLIEKLIVLELLPLPERRNDQKQPSIDQRFQTYLIDFVVEFLQNNGLPFDHLYSESSLKKTKV